jgi:hypothetical protein
MDWLRWEWDYKDRFGSDNLDFASNRDTLLFTTSKNFGDYVSLTLTYTIERRDETGSGAGGSRSGNQKPQSIGGAFEFIF